MRSGLIVAPIEELLENPRYFPVHADLDHDRLVLLETTRARLASIPFLDGRHPFAEGSAIEVSLSDALAAGWRQPEPADRFIFHVAFCGSTLLSTLLDIPGRSFAVREPQVLIDLANAKASAPPHHFRSTLNLVTGLLRRPWAARERNLIKPSNWANNLIADLAAWPHPKRALFITTGEREYLHALFRGGRERMEYVIRSTHHLLQGISDGAVLWQQACSNSNGSLDIAARLALIAIHLQLDLFEGTMQSGSWGEPTVLTLDEIESDPIGACVAASEALDLNMPLRELERAVAIRLGSHAKNPNQDYSPELRRTQEHQVRIAYGPAIDRALDWAALTGIQDRFKNEGPGSAFALPAFPQTLCA